MIDSGSVLHNRINRNQLRVKYSRDNDLRKTVSFYRYVEISDPQSLRDFLYREFWSIGVLGRVYVSKEGVNAQISVLEERSVDFFELMESISIFKGVPLKFAIDDTKHSFIKLVIKVREKIVADGLENFQLKEVGKSINALEFYKKVCSGATVVDMRNHYESEVGHFIGAKLSNTETFREALQKLPDLIGSQKEEEIILYCTGGIRCEKASAYLKNLGYKNVYQLDGGIISYVHQVKKEGLKNLFVGKNFVFDDRLGERITGDVISFCHLCKEASDQHINCSNDGCHLLFISCVSCSNLYEGCCSIVCQTEIRMEGELQKARRKGIPAMGCHRGPWHYSFVKEEDLPEKKVGQQKS